MYEVLETIMALAYEAKSNGSDTAKYLVLGQVTSRKIDLIGLCYRISSDWFIKPEVLDVPEHFWILAVSFLQNRA